MLWRRHIQKATRHNYVPADVHSILEKDLLTLKSQLITNIRETRDWSKDFIDAIMNALKKKPIATKYSNYHTNSLTAHAAKMVVRILTRNT
jgi:hypothetical protein